MSPVATLVAFALLAGCTGGAGGASDPPADGTILVFAAASLADVFDEIADAYSSEHPDVDVELNVAGSSSLAVQIEEGAPADVVAMADVESMRRLDGLVDAVEIFATNDLVVATPADDPGGVAATGDLERPDVLVGVCAAQVPCGRYADLLFANLGIEPSVVTEEPDVRALTTKLEEGELDAGVVYATDVASSAGALRTVPIASDDRVLATYPIATIAASTDHATALDFVEFIRSADGRAILHAAGFGIP